VAPPDELGPLALSQIESIDFEALGGDLATTIELIEQSGLNS